MKKIMMVAIILIAFASCTSKPKVNYDIPDYVSESDWKLSKNKKTDSVVLYQVDKKIKLDEKYFPSVKDSVGFSFMLTNDKFKKLPNSDSLRSEIFKCLLESQSACMSSATFDPKNISFYISEDEKTKKETLVISVVFFASNAYGTPGKLQGYFTYDLKTMKLIDSLIG